MRIAECNAVKIRYVPARWVPSSARLQAGNALGAVRPISPFVDRVAARASVNESLIADDASLDAGFRHPSPSPDGQGFRQAERGSPAGNTQLFQRSAEKTYDDKT